MPYLTKRHPSFGRWVRTHVFICEQALGKPLPKGAQVHHVNGDETDNRNCNLVVCENQLYHRLLHWRQRAHDFGLDLRARPCKFCKQWDILDNPDFREGWARGQYTWWHKSCSRKYFKEFRKTHKFTLVKGKYKWIPVNTSAQSV